MRHTAPVNKKLNMAPFSKEDKILIKVLYECEGYNAWQFITISISKLNKEHHQQAAGEVEKFETVRRIIFVTSGNAI